MNAGRAPHQLREVSPRMRALLDAGVVVIAQQGLRGLTHRAVDRQAGLPEGSCSAYLRTRLALLSALAEDVASQCADDVRALTDVLTDRPGDRELALRETTAMFLRWLDHPELLQARLELTLEGARQPELAELNAAWARELLSLIERVVTDEPDPHLLASVLLAATDGVLVRALREAPADRPAYLSQSLGMLISALADPSRSVTAE